GSSPSEASEDRRSPRGLREVPRHLGEDTDGTDLRPNAQGPRKGPVTRQRVTEHLGKNRMSAAEEAPRSRKTRRGSRGEHDESPRSTTLARPSSGKAPRARMRSGTEATVSEPVGSFLKRHRETKGMSVVEVSRVTRIPVISIEAIESDRF